MNDLTINANLAIVLRGDILDLRQIALNLDAILKEHPEVKVVHHQTSASKLWIKAEGEKDEGQR